MLTFFSEDTDFSFPVDESIMLEKIQAIAQDHSFRITALNYIFCSDSYLLTINQNYLQHDYFTDIITFDNSDEVNLIEGDIFISIDRVKENASHYNISFQHELFRVFIHGLLHLLGYSDKSLDEQNMMRAAEDKYLHQYFQSFIC